MKQLIISRAAQKDAKKAADYYTEKAGPAIADEFIQKNELVLERIRKNPEQFQAVYKKKVRRAVLEKFPYNTFFVDQAEKTTVIAVQHQASHPKKWKNRADKVLKNGK